MLFRSSFNGNCQLSNLTHLVEIDYGRGRSYNETSGRNDLQPERQRSNVYDRFRLGIRVAYEVHIEEFKFQAIDEYISNLDDDNAEMSREWVRGKAKGIIVPLTHSSTFSHAFMSCLQKIIRFTSV